MKPPPFEELELLPPPEPFSLPEFGSLVSGRSGLRGLRIPGHLVAVQAELAMVVTSKMPTVKRE